METKLLERLAIVPKNDSTGYDSLLFMEDTLVFENRVVIIFECLSLNIYFYQKMMMERGEEQAYNEL